MENDTFIKGFRLTFENAQRLYNAAKVLEKKEEFAIANSLLILSAEEGIKAYTILNQYFFPNKKFDDFDKYSKDHKQKLKTIKSVSIISQIAEKFYELFYVPIIENTIESKEDKKTIRHNSFQNLLTWLENEAKLKHTELSKQSAWWMHANTMKKNGFYVSYNNGQWTNPSSIKKDNYLKSKKHVSTFINQVDVLYNLDFNNKLLQDLIAEMKNEKK